MLYVVQAESQFRAWFEAFVLCTKRNRIENLRTKVLDTVTFGALEYGEETRMKALKRHESHCGNTNSRREDLNLRPTVYETVALPLSYAGSIIAIITSFPNPNKWRSNGRFGNRGIPY